MDIQQHYFREDLPDTAINADFASAQSADRAIVGDLALFGIYTGLALTPRASLPDISVDVSVGAAYDQDGARLPVFRDGVTTFNLPLSQSGITIAGGAPDGSTSMQLDSTQAPIVATTVVGTGNERWLSIFVRQGRVLSDPRVDGQGRSLFYSQVESFRLEIVAGGEAVAGQGVRPALKDDAILLGDVKLTEGDTSVDAADIDLSRTQYAIKVDGSTRSIARGQLLEAFSDLLGFYNDHIEGDGDTHPATAISATDPGAWADEVAIPAGTVPNVQAGLDRIVVDLASKSGSGGASRVGAVQVAGTNFTLATGSVGTQLASLAAQVDTLLASVFSADGITYDGAPTNYADGTSPIGTNVNEALDDIVNQLGGATGTQRIGGIQYAPAGKIHALAAGTLYTQLQTLLDAVNLHQDGTANPHPASDVTTINFSTLAGGQQINQGSVQSSIDQLITFLGATTGTAGGDVIGNRSISGSPNSVTAGTLYSQLSQILTDLNNHIGGSDQHPADEVTTAFIAPTLTGLQINQGDVQASLAYLVAMLGGQTSPVSGTENIGGIALTGSPDSVVAGPLNVQLQSLLNFINSKLDVTGAYTWTAKQNFDDEIEMDAGDDLRGNPPCTAYIAYSGVRPNSTSSKRVAAATYRTRLINVGSAYTFDDLGSSPGGGWSGALIESNADRSGVAISQTVGTGSAGDGEYYYGILTVTG